MSYVIRVRYVKEYVEAQPYFEAIKLMKNVRYAEIGISKDGIPFGPKLVTEIQDATIFESKIEAILVSKLIRTDYWDAPQRDVFTPTKLELQIIEIDPKTMFNIDFIT